MLTLGIETSCDETSCAVLRGRDQLLSNIISSSLFRHKPFGGVVPEIASRHSLEQIDTVYAEALKEAGVQAEEIGLIAVTHGPGLIGSLFVGVCFAKALAYQLDIPLVGVNHLEAHLVANFLGHYEPESYIGLLISGGHTSLSYHQGGSVEMLGATVDDAVGEAFDKVAKLLGLGYPGGPVIEKRARLGNAKTFSFTKPKQENLLDFSFSGIKTAVLHEVQKESMGEIQKGNVAGSEKLSEDFVNALCASFQSAAVQWLVEKTLAAAKLKSCRHVVVGGGVSANQFLKKEIEAAALSVDVDVRFPERTLSLDNAGMIARRGIEVYEKEPAQDWMHLGGVPSLKMG